MSSRGATSAATVGLALLAVSLNRFVLSGLSAALPHVVAEGTLVTANSLSTTLGTAAATVGGFASLGLRALWGRDDAGAGAIAAVGAAVYLVAAVLARSIDRNRLGPSDAVDAQPLRRALSTVVAGLVAGGGHLRRRPVASLALLAIAAHRFVSGLLFVVVLLVFTQRGYLHGDLGALGLTAGAAVAGGLVAAAITPRLSRALGTQRWVVVSLAASGLSTGVLFPSYQRWAITAGALLLGLAAQAVKICVDTLVQQATDDAFRGRVFALYDVLFNVSFVAAAVVAAVVVPDDGHSVLVVLSVATGYLLIAGGYLVVTGTTAVTDPASPAASAPS